MTTKTFVLNNGTELTPEETIQYLLKRVNETNNALISLQTELDHLIIRLNEHDHV
jgi:hypothetical protein